jgi:hypothetical protein
VVKNQSSPYHLYESAYQKLQNSLQSSPQDLPPVNHSLLEFVAQNTNWGEAAKILELGCGSDSLANYVGKSFERWLALDFSPTALSLARQHCRDSRVEFFNADVASNPMLPWSGFELVIDAHCLHCMTAKSQAMSMLLWSLSHLKRGGQLMIESMVAGPELELEFDFSWNGEQVLQKMQGIWNPVRLLLDPDELQRLLKEAAALGSARLSFFAVDTQKKISLRDDSWHDGHGQPYCARAILQRF